MSGERAAPREPPPLEPRPSGRGPADGSDAPPAPARTGAEVRGVAGAAETGGGRLPDGRGPTAEPSAWGWKGSAVLLGVAVSGVCLWLAVRGADLSEVPPAFAAADYRTLPLVGALLAGFFWTKAVRWAALLRPLRPRTPDGPTGEPFTTVGVLPAVLIGFAGNNVLPAHAGEFFRVAVVAKRWRVSAAAVLSTVVLERVLDVGAILLLFAAGVPAIPGAGEEYGWVLFAASAGLLAAAAGCGLFLWKTEACVRLAAAGLARLPFVPGAVRLGVPRLLGQAAAGLAALKSGRALAGIAALSVLHWALMAGMIWLCFASFGVRLPAAAGAVVNGVIAFGVLAPSTPGFFGVVQVCFRAGAAPFGVSAADALSASIFYQVTQWVPVTLAGAVCAAKAGLWGGQAAASAGAPAASAPPAPSFEADSG